MLGGASLPLVLVSGRRLAPSSCVSSRKRVPSGAALGLEVSWLPGSGGCCYVLAHCPFPFFLQQDIGAGREPWGPAPASPPHPTPAHWPGFPHSMLKLTQKQRQGILGVLEEQPPEQDFCAVQGPGTRSCFIPTVIV